MTRLIAAAAFFAVLQIASAEAQTAANCTPTTTLSDPNSITTTGKPGEALGDKLARSDGVLCPPTGVDPAIATPAPDRGTARTPVIPPPGSPGGDPSVRPK